ncbi:MAG: hypothetical protein HC831_25755, partial [Chloroflexia bacterium]|nr:hypothetical protein [Chloroflexia bacterium]
KRRKKYRYYAGLQILTDSAFHLLKLPDLDEICNYAGKILLQNVPNSVIVFSNINPETKKSKPHKFYGINEPKLFQLFEKTDFRPYESLVTLPQKEYNLLEKRTLIEYKGGFPAFINAIFPEKDANEINRVFKFENLYIIGLEQKENLSNSILIISREKADIPNKEFIEAFINLVSVVINRKYIEEELKNLNKTKDKFFSNYLS